MAIFLSLGTVIAYLVSLVPDNPAGLVNQAAGVAAQNNFESYQLKAKQAEAKMMLSTVYTAQRANDVEFGGFSSDLESLNVSTQSDSGRYFVGFADTPEWQAICPDCVVSETGFKAMAVGNLDDDETLDVWTIDENRQVEHLINDIEN